MNVLMPYAMTFVVWIILTAILELYYEKESRKAFLLTCSTLAFFIFLALLLL